MTKSLKQIEEEAWRARIALSEDVHALKGWFYGVSPLMWFFVGKPYLHSSRRAELRRGDGERRANLLPLLLVALGTGWLLRDAVRRGRRDDEGCCCRRYR